MAGNKKSQVAVEQLAENLSQAVPHPADHGDDELLNPEQVARIFGCCVTTVHRLANKGLLEFIRFGYNGRGKRFRKSVVLKGVVKASAGKGA
jgi:helix-turn-helix protein